MPISILRPILRPIRPKGAFGLAQDEARHTLMLSRAKRVSKHAPAAQPCVAVFQPAPMHPHSGNHRPRPKPIRL